MIDPEIWDVVASNAASANAVNPAASWDDDDLFEGKPLATGGGPASVLAPVGVSVVDSSSVRVQRSEKLRAKRKVKRSSRLPAWIWGLFGFVFGIVFWHGIGFWGFMNDVLLPQQKPMAAQAGQDAVPFSQAPSPTGNLHIRATSKSRP